jgi:hypothetical protein
MADRWLREDGGLWLLEAAGGFAWERERTGYAAAILADSPAAYWRLGEASGTVADNAEGTAARDGTYVNAPTLGVAGALTGDADTAATFVAASSQRVTTTCAYAAGAGSTEAWFKTTSVASAGNQIIILGMSSGGSQYEAQVGVDENGKLAGAFTWAALGPSTAAVNDGNWHHVVLAWNANATNQATMYLDGSVVEANKGSNAFLGTNNVAIAASSAGYGPFDGSIDEAAYYSYQLTSTQVAAHYAAGAPAAAFDPAPFAGLYQTEEPTDWIAVW